MAEASMPEPAGLGGGRHQPGAGHPSHTGLHDGVLDADQLAEPGSERRGPPQEALGRACPSTGHLFVPQPTGVETRR